MLVSRVLHVVQPTEAGVAGVVAELVAGQVDAGWDVFSACPPTGPLAGALAEAGARVVPWPATRGITSVVGETWRLRSVIARVAPDLVHLHSAKAGLAGRLAIRGRLPTVYQPHAWSFEAVTGAARWGAVAWERYAVRWTRHLACVSEHERERGERLGINATAVVVPNGINLTRFPARDDADRSRARTSLCLPDGPTVVCVGRLCRQKGQDLLLAAWPGVVAAVPDARLVLVGDGPERTALMAMAPAAVTFAGHAHDPRPWYAAADVVAMPSRWEGMALVLLEAMASARCVVATDVGGVREVMPDRGGAMVAVGDVAALTAALVARLARPALAAAEAAAGRLRVAARHDIARVIRHMRAVYVETTAEPRKVST